MKANQADFAIKTMAQVLGVSTSGYYDWQDRAPGRRAQDNAILFKQIKQIHQDSDATYGRPRIVAELLDQGRCVNHKRVGRLMCQHGIRGVSRRRSFTRTTRRDRTARAAPDLVNREFVADGPNQLWVADLTYVPTWQGFIYLAVVLDVWSRRVVGWAIRETMHTVIVTSALNMAIEQRRLKPNQVIHHSDQGSQYTDKEMIKRCKDVGIARSMGSVGDAYDNAMAESFFASLECELIDRRTWKTRTQARHDLFAWIEGWYNPRRRHSAIDQMSPVKFEALHADAFLNQTPRAKPELPTGGVAVATPPVGNSALASMNPA